MRKIQMLVLASLLMVSLPISAKTFTPEDLNCFSDYECMWLNFQDTSTLGVAKGCADWKCNLSKWTCQPLINLDDCGLVAGLYTEDCVNESECMVSFKHPRVNKCFTDNQVKNYTSCEPSGECFKGGRCMSGNCYDRGVVDCEDNNPCTWDYCDPELGCVNEVMLNGLNCDDGSGDPKVCLMGMCVEAECYYDHDCAEGTICEYNGYYQIQEKATGKPVLWGSYWLFDIGCCNTDADCVGSPSGSMCVHDIADGLKAVLGTQGLCQKCRTSIDCDEAKGEVCLTYDSPLYHKWSLEDDYISKGIYTYDDLTNFPDPRIKYVCAVPE